MEKVISPPSTLNLHARVPRFLNKTINVKIKRKKLPNLFQNLVSANMSFNKTIYYLNIKDSFIRYNAIGIPPNANYP